MPEYPMTHGSAQVADLPTPNLLQPAPLFYADEYQSMNNAIRSKLCAMMFLEFFIWGAWLPLIFGYLPSLGFSSLQSGLILNAFALASFTAMFFSTQFADRNFAAEKFLAVSQVIGGVAIISLAWTKSFVPFFVLM